ncbi:PP2C family protein-serine/threonine phosphatase [Streptomyces sp. S.PB5]|uniref:PP2C family protein-serine/threonine phosphatase n=1 Tax=Streptomyces sp. S.PB5 TaxID=3020844 RepID=UPI0025B12A9C|nr:PP2C family protein-serine/threonine phosphatase [Streptomyces sp. S.PB5]MDN3024147.1 PP2C family protein-serine/threonine phosphatase [Streptomyces sp. S.PB5]
MNALRTVGRRPPSRRLLLSPLPPLGLCLLITALDLLFDMLGQLVALLLIGPVLAGTRLGVRSTAVVCGVALLLGLLLGATTGNLLAPDFAVRGSGLLLGCVLAVQAARRHTLLRTTLKRSRQVTRATQEALLRPVSATLDGTQVCTRYHSATQESHLSGDVYDVVVTPYGLRLLVGDVRGHDLDSLRLAAATLAAFRDLAPVAPHLPALATDLDARLAPEFGPEDFVTAVLAEFAPGEVRLVNCGHPAPLRVGARLDLLEPGESAPPLGLGPQPSQYRHRLDGSDRVLFYTDGLTEARDRDGTPFPLLDEAAATLRDPLPEQAVDALHARLTAHIGRPPTDDLTLVLCQPELTAAPLAVSDGVLRRS